MHRQQNAVNMPLFGLKSLPNKQNQEPKKKKKKVAFSKNTTIHLLMDLKDETEIMHTAFKY